MNHYDVALTKKHLIGLELTDVQIVSEDIHLIFEDNLTLILTGGYCREVFATIKKRVISFEDVKE